MVERLVAEVLRERKPKNKTRRPDAALNFATLPDAMGIRNKAIQFTAAVRHLDEGLQAGCVDG